MSFRLSRLAHLVRTCRNDGPPSISLSKTPAGVKTVVFTSSRSFSNGLSKEIPLDEHDRSHFARQYSTASSDQPSLKAHNEAVKDISATIKGYYERKQKFRITHGTTNSTRLPSSKGANLVDLSKLNNVLAIDVVNKTALVEPNVPMDRLVEATMKHGLVPPIVMDFPGITVGGGYAGTSGESSSYNHGFFDRTMNYTEMVLANGEVVRTSGTERADLFHGAAGAVGTLGTTTLVELRLEEAKDYVQVTYHAVSSMAEAISKIKTFTADPSLNYVDGIMYSMTQGAIITGRKTNTPTTGTPVARFSAPRDPWYYLHVQSQISNNPSDPVTEAVPLADYLFRYDRGGFWVGRMAFHYFSFPFNKFTRWWLDDFLHTRMMYTALHAGGQAKQIVVQDLALPYESAEEFVEYTNETFGIWPLWLCPLKTTDGPTFHPHCTTANADGKRDTGMLNIGLWGKGPSSHDAFVKLNRNLETKLRELGGMKWLYAHTYYSEPEFWKVYGGREWYDRLRAKYHATGLPSVYEKVRVDVDKERAEGKRQWWLSIWPVGGFVGLWKSIQSRAYVQARNAAWMKIEPGQKKDVK